jgi:tRNA A-37 threonylcarbamoyl transferase component Bud32
MDVPQFIAGRFRIECEIGRGGMGTVYRATHLGLQRSVAVKIIKSEYADDTDVADRFMREARTMAKLRHPRAAMIFDAGNLPDGRHFIIMEFIEGTTLSEALAREGRFSPERAINIAVQVCDVLEEAHQLGIIHRDLKPSNIMLNERGVCVVDFGVAKVLASSADATASQASTGSGQIVGTPRYMSPEQCLGQRVGARSDLYSLGVVLYEMLTGRPPFVDPLPSVVLVKQATAPPPPLPTLRQDVPRSLALAVHTLLAKRSEDRPQTAARARSMLETILLEPGPAEFLAPEVEPFSSTVAAANYSRSAIFRVAAPLILVSILGALLLALGYGGPAAEMAATADKVSAEMAARRAKAGAATQGNQLDNGEHGAIAKESDLKPGPNLPLSLDQARRIVASLSPGAIGDVAVAQNASGPTIVAIHDESKSGKTHFFAMKLRGSAYRITDRGSLDMPNFRARKWTAEKVDAGGDGRDQILFTGISHAGWRLVLYDPETRQNYSLRIETDSRSGQARQIHWSDNTADSSVAAYRVALREKARTISRSTQLKL